MNKQEALSILHLTSNAEEKDIKNAYKKLAVIYHPDRNVSNSEKERATREENFKQISNAYHYLISENDLVFDNVNATHKNSEDFVDFISQFLRVPTKQSCLRDFREIFNDVGLSLNNLQIFNLMEEDEVFGITDSVNYLYRHDCLTQESFDLVCEYTDWPGKTPYDAENPYAAKYIIESFCTKIGLTINEHNFPIKYYTELPEAIAELLGCDELYDWDEESNDTHLLTQERLDKLLEFPWLADRLAYSFNLFDKVGILNESNEDRLYNLAILKGASSFSDFTYNLGGKKTAEDRQSYLDKHEKLMASGPFNEAASKIQGQFRKYHAHLNFFSAVPSDTSVITSVEKVQQTKSI